MALEWIWYFIWYSFLGFLLGPPVIGHIAHAFSLRWSFSLIALVGLGTAFIAPFLKKFR